MCDWSDYISCRLFSHIGWSNGSRSHYISHAVSNLSGIELDIYASFLPIGSQNMLLLSADFSSTKMNNILFSKSCSVHTKKFLKLWVALLSGKLFIILLVSMKICPSNSVP